MRKLFFSLIFAIIALQAFSQANTSLSNLVSPTTINVSLLPETFNSKTLGSSSKTWKDLYLDGVVYRQGDPWIAGNFTSFSTFVGQNAGFSCLNQSNSESNTFIGASAGYATTTGTANTFLGAFAGSDNTTGGGNVFLGKDAGSDNTTGNDNLFVGIVAGTRNTTGAYNVCLGYAAGNFNHTGISNCFVGSLSGFSNNDGDYNSAFGESALYYNTTGGNNTAIGAYALKSNTTGSNNAANGIQSLNFNTTGSFNTAAGRNALYLNTIGGYNTAIGYGSGGQNDNNTFCSFFGYDADQTVNTDFTNSMALGNTARITASNQVRIGSSGITSIGGYVGWSNISDGRYKKDIRENVPGLEFIDKLKPVTYHLDVSGIRSALGEDKNGEEATTLSTSDSPSSPDEMIKQKEQIIYSGFIAQEVEKAAKEIGYDFSGVDAPKNENDLYGLRYAEFVVPFVKAVQELSVDAEGQKIQDAKLKDEIEKLSAALLAEKSENAQLKLRLDKIEAMLQSPSENISSVEEINQQKVELNGNAARLDQNIPNPFTQSAVISYFLPETTTEAQINFYDLHGKLLKSVSLITRGAGSIEVQQNDLAAGVYTYQLVIDGKVFDMKKMVLTK